MKAMSTATTYTPIAAGEPRTARSWWGRIFDRMIEAQMQVARRQISEHLRFLSDATLSELGFGKAEIARLRAGRWVDFPK